MDEDDREAGGEHGTRRFQAAPRLARLLRVRHRQQQIGMAQQQGGLGAVGAGPAVQGERGVRDGLLVVAVEGQEVGTAGGLGVEGRAKRR